MKKEKKYSWKKVFYIISFGQFFSILGSSTVQFAIIWWLTLKTNSAIVLSLAAMVGFLPQALLSPIIGTVVDRINRKKAMIGADLLVALATLTLIVGLFLGYESIWMIYVILIIRAVGSTLHTTAMQASMPIIVPRDKIQLAVSMAQTIYSVSNILGPILGAFLLAFLPFESVLFIDIFGAIIACITLIIVEIKQPEKTYEDKIYQGWKQEIMYGLKLLLQKKGVFSLTIIYAIHMLLYLSSAALFTLMVSAHYHGDALQASLAEVLFSTGTFFGSIGIGLIGKKVKKTKIIFWDLFFLSLSLLGVGFSKENQFWIFAVMSCVMGACGPVFNVTYNALIQTLFESSVLGRVLGIVNSITIMATPVGLLIAGPVTEVIGVTTWFIVSGFATIVLAFGCKGNKGVKELEKNWRNSIVISEKVV